MKRKKILLLPHNINILKNEGHMGAILYILLPLFIGNVELVLKRQLFEEEEGKAR